MICIILGLVLLSGCVSQPTPVVPVQTTTPTVIPTETTIATLAAVSTPTQTYKHADISFGLNPAYGFTMDYPSEWTFAKEDTPMWYVSPDRILNSCGWSPGYNFSSPDKKSLVYVMFANKANLLYCMEPLAAWADTCIRSMKLNSYCHDGAGNRINCGPNERYMYHMSLFSNKTVTLSGNVVAEKLVFTSYDDESTGWDTFYLMYAGRIQGYNYTVPGRTDYYEEAPGPAWDCGKGGIRYGIYLYTPRDQVNVTSDIFNHMIASFRVTPDQIFL